MFLHGCTFHCSVIVFVFFPSIFCIPFYCLSFELQNYFSIVPCRNMEAWLNTTADNLHIRVTAWHALHCLAFLCKVCLCLVLRE